MHGRRYYFTTLGAWRRHAGRCAETHFVLLGGAEKQNGHVSVASQQSEATDDCDSVPADNTQTVAHHGGLPCATDDATPILALIDADDGAHLAMENDAEFESLPQPLARTPVSQRVATALRQFGVERGDDTFAVAEKLARVNPLMRHRVF